MTIVQKVLDAVASTPNSSVREIISTVGANANTVKVTVTKLAKQGKIVRDKSPTKDKRKGPQSEYVYRIGQDSRKKATKAKGILVQR